MRTTLLDNDCSTKKKKPLTRVRICRKNWKLYNSIGSLITDYLQQLLNEGESFSLQEIQELIGFQNAEALPASHIKCAPAEL